MLKSYTYYQRNHFVKSFKEKIKKKKASNKYVCVCIYIYSATNTSIYKLIRVRAKTSIDDSCRIKTQLQDG